MYKHVTHNIEYNTVIELTEVF